MKKSIIKRDVGIFLDAEYTVRDYKDKIVVTVPFIRWRGNEGNLAYRKVRVTDAFRMDAVRKFADRGKYWLPCKSKMLGATIDDVLDGYVTPDIEII